MNVEDEYKSRIRRNVNRIIRELTDDGNVDFESVAYQNFKSEFKNEDECVVVILEVLLETASRSGCPDRRLILRVINDCFLDVKKFRNEILNDSSEFLELMVETNPIRKPLPGSKKHGNTLKAEAIRVIKEWEKKYAKIDARMKCMVVTLKKTKFVDYENEDKKVEERRRRIAEIEEMRQKMIHNTLVAYQSKFMQIKEDVENLAVELNAAMELLVPSFITENPTSSNPTSVPSTSTKSAIKQFEIFIPDLSPEIVISMENDAIVESFLGTKLMLIHRVQTLRKLAKRLKALKEPGEELAQTIIDYRDDIKKLVLKACELKISKGKERRNKQQPEKSRFDDDFIDVEISIDDILMARYAEQDEHEENKNSEEFKEANISNKRKTISPRQYTFVGEATKEIKRACLAKLPSGAFCPRKDYHKCPIHGKIVDRDEQGRAVHEKDRMEEARAKEKRQLEEAKVFQEQIEKHYHEKTKRKKKNHVETTVSEDVRNRLQKKLLGPKNKSVS